MTVADRPWRRPSHTPAPARPAADVAAGGAVAQPVEGPYVGLVTRAFASAIDAALLLAALPLFAGFLLVLVDDRRRGLHDRLARTVVVEAPLERLRRDGAARPVRDPGAS